MVYVIDQAHSGRNSRTGQFEHWDAKVPDVSHRARITRAFQNGGEELAPWEVPEHLKITARTGKLPFFFTTGNHGRVIHGILADIVERFDPGQHQFFPLRVTWRNGDEIAGPWFLLNIVRAEDTICEAGTKYRAIYGGEYVEVERDGRKTWMEDKSKIIARHLDYSLGPQKTGKKVIYDPARLSGNSHLWRELRFGDAILCSDELWAALNPKGPKRIAGFKAKQMRHGPLAKLTPTSPFDTLRRNAARARG
jgi:hypothetical protein